MWTDEDLGAVADRAAEGEMGAGEAFLAFMEAADEIARALLRGDPEGEAAKARRGELCFVRDACLNRLESLEGAGELAATARACADRLWAMERAAANVYDPRRGPALALDAETTGLDPEADEVLELAICDARTGEEIWNRRYGTERRREWREAEAVNHISPADVAGRPTLREGAAEVRAILEGAGLLVIYNAPFDLAFLEAAGALGEAGAPEICDAMEEFSRVYGEWDPRHGGHKWQRLAKAAEHVGHAWSGEAHTALADARAAAAVWRWLEERGEAVRQPRA